MNILLVEDDKKISENIRESLELDGVDVAQAYTYKSGLDTCYEGNYDCIILDRRLPDGDGMDLCTALRKQNILTPIILLTALGQVNDKIDGLNSGADDYLVKPFDMRELISRVNALVRRSTSQESEPPLEILILESLTIDLNKASVIRDDVEITLSPKEYDLLVYLLKNKCIVHTRQEILENVWDMNSDLLTNTVDVHIRYLRKKIDEPFQKSLIHTVKGKGYMICAD